MPISNYPTRSISHRPSMANSISSDDSESSTITASSTTTNKSLWGKLSPRKPMRKASTRRLVRSVSFEEDPVSDVRKVALYEQKTDIWYSKEEMKLIKKRNQLIVYLKENGGFEESDDHTFLGLDSMLDGDKIQTKRETIYGAVLREQQKLSSRRKTVNAERIAKVYKEQMRQVA
ncbi:hypothetical protein FisN_40Lh009 [Fistulifera solaris]|uniref:Uncharacterized protein n=1 Tax=Fistulifera solaris TaxID=1519565 RepID=A0A1Z5J9W1_FISSO|nr:hypothetical protein FisN_40Lh009 [Fistulifera solaris]|eukprot:GAX10541.1 hypothetical protein FisN_40Lh009 [Fistulifera solaris]